MHQPDLPMVEPEVTGGHIVIVLDPQRVRLVLARQLIRQHVRHAQPAARRYLHKLLVRRLHRRGRHTVVSPSCHGRNYIKSKNAILCCKYSQYYKMLMNINIQLPLYLQYGLINTITQQSSFV